MQETELPVSDLMNRFQRERSSLVTDQNRPSGIKYRTQKTNKPRRTLLTLSE